MTGFAVVGEYQDEAIKQAQKQAFEVVLEWLKAGKRELLQLQT